MASHPRKRPLVWLFDLDDTLHDAGAASMPHLHEAMGEYVQRELGLGPAEASALRTHYWQRYGATLLGLVRHHEVQADDFLRRTHELPGLEARIRGDRADIAALGRLSGRKIILTNAPLAYAKRVLKVLGLQREFEAVLSIESMVQFGQLRPKPDARMLRAVAAGLGVLPEHCVLVEDTLVHQKSARSIGMKTVWMRRWLRGKRSRFYRPTYVGQAVSRLRDVRGA